MSRTPSKRDNVARSWICSHAPFADPAYEGSVTEGPNYDRMSERDKVTAEQDIFNNLLSMSQQAVEQAARQFAAQAEAPWSSPGMPPRSAPKPKAARRKAPNRRVAKRTVAKRTAAPTRTSPQTVRRTVPQTVTLEGMVDSKSLGGYSLSFAAGQLSVDSPRIGGMYGVEVLPIGEWFVLVDGRGVPLPVAIQRARMDAYCVRVDPVPLRGLRTLASYPGWVPSASGASPDQRTPRQQRQTDQMAVRAIQTGLNAENQAAINTARHMDF